jgi:hypothetical protein
MFSSEKMREIRKFRRELAGEVHLFEESAKRAQDVPTFASSLI